MRIKTCIVVLLTALLVMSASSAEELTVSGRVNAVMYADKALEEHFGITLLLQDYFLRTVEEKEDNVFIVRYEGIENYAYVLGRYEVTVDRNHVTGITWSHDGEDTSGGFKAEAWGAEQIMEMLRLNQEAGTTEPFDARINEIGRKHGFVYVPNILSDEENERKMARIEKNCEKARNLSTLSIEEMTEIGRRAVASLYGLSPERERALESVVDEEELPLWYTIFEGEPCYQVCLGLDDKEEDDVLPNGLRYTEKEGNYWIYINSQTGVVEDIHYSPAIGGNG